MLASLLQAIPAIVTGFQGKDTKKIKKTSGEMENLARAQYDTNSPLYQQIYEQQKGAGQQDLASTIAELSRQNRKLQTMGRTPLLDQERGGESIFRNLILGQEDVGNRARENTFERLRAGQNSMSGVYNTQNNIADQDYDNNLKKVGAYYSIGDALKGLFGLQGQEQPQEEIIWNSARRSS